MESFGARCLADIPHPNFLPLHDTTRGQNLSHNPEVLEAYTEWYTVRHSKRRLRQTRNWIREIKKVITDYHAADIQIFEEIQRHYIANQAQMASLTERDAIVFNDILSEDDTRSKYPQRRSDMYINLTLYQTC